jgi:hypothetical protein
MGLNGGRQRTCLPSSSAGTPMRRPQNGRGNVTVCGGMCVEGGDPTPGGPRMVRTERMVHSNRFAIKPTLPARSHESMSKNALAPPSAVAPRVRCPFSGVTI